MKKNLVTYILIGMSLSGYCVEHTDSTRLMFRQSYGVLDSLFDGNRTRLDSMAREMREVINKDSVLFRVAGVKVIGGASPEGSVEINSRLSRERANTIFDYFSEVTPLDDSITSFSFLGRDWKGLYSLVENDECVPYRDEVLATLRQIISETADGEKESYGNLAKIKNIRGGVPYRYMYERLFPALRESRLYVSYAERQPELRGTLIPPYVVEECLTLYPDIPAPQGAPEKCCSPFYMAIKTNMLYDVLALPNVGVEFYIGKNFSIAGNWTYGWWDNDHRHRYWRAYGGDITLRKWFGRKAAEKPLTGHHIGLYAGVLTYDFEWGGTGYMGGLPGKTLWDRCLFNGGIEYGYSLPVGRRINIDFTIGIGILHGKYLKYRPQANSYYWESTHKLDWVGPTKAEVSLVWLIGCDNYNRKGGMK